MAVAREAVVWGGSVFQFRTRPTDEGDGARRAPRLNCNRYLVAALMFAMLTGVAGCTTTREYFNEYPVKQVPPVLAETTAPSLGHQPEPEYHLQPGDALNLQSYYDPALKQVVTVRPDGRISLVLLGDVRVAGKTSAELDQELKQAYGERLPAHPDITVTVDQIADQVVYVGGEVKTPTIEPLKGSLTLLQSIMEAGGYLATANQDQVIIVRKEAGGKFHAYQQNARLVLTNQTSEIALQPHDIVFVPKTAIARVDQYVDQYINQVVPDSFKFNFGYMFENISGNSTHLR